MTDPLVGTELGSYRIERKIAAGGMGTIYLGVQPTIGSRVAIKVLSDRCAKDPALVERFFSEARAVNLIKHESIVSVIDMAVLADGRPYLVMEFIDGQTLSHIVQRAWPVRAPLGGIAQACGEALSALAAAHAIGIVHRDLKPANIMITAKGHAKLADFGIAKLARGLGHELAPRTYTDDFLGTPAYMSPEQIASANTVDARSDIYAMGVVLYEAVTGRVPFIGTSFEIMRAHVDAAPPPPSSLRPDLPAAFEAVIMTALAKDPAHRFANATAMANALASAARELPPEQQASLSLVPEAPVARHADTPMAPSVVAPSAVVPPPSPRRRRWWLVLVPLPALVAVPLFVIGGKAPLAKLVDPRVTEPTKFDLQAFLPTAIALARQAAPDARLVAFEGGPLIARGRVDLTRASPGDNYVRFISPTKPCQIDVVIGVRRATVSRRDAPCTEKPVRLPTCRLATMLEATMSAYLDKQIGGVLLGSSETTVRYQAGAKNPRWILSGLASDEVPDDCENGDKDGP